MRGRLLTHRLPCSATEHVATAKAALRDAQGLLRTYENLRMKDKVIKAQADVMTKQKEAEEAAAALAQLASRELAELQNLNHRLHLAQNRLAQLLSGLQQEGDVEEAVRSCAESSVCE